MAFLTGMKNPILAPAEFAGHADVKFTFQYIFTPFYNDHIIRPGYFSHQWCEFCIIFEIHSRAVTSCRLGKSCSADFPL